MLDKMPQFRPWINKVMPSVYDDSLTYYEALSKVVGYTNQLGDKTNEMLDYMDGVFSAQNNGLDGLRKEFAQFRSDMNNNLKNYQLKIDNQMSDFQTKIEIDQADFHLHVNEEITKLNADFNQFQVDMNTRYQQFINDVMQVTMPENVERILNEWFDNGRLAEIINNDVFNMKADKTELNALSGQVDINITDIANLKDRINIIAKYPASFFGIKSDGITDDTEAMKRAGNTFSNIEVIFPENSTTIISDKIDLVKDGVVFVGRTGSKIKMKANSGLLQKVISGEYQKTPDMIGCFRKGCGVKGLEIDGNVYENFVMYGGEKYSAFYTANAIPGQPYVGGYGGIGLSADDTFAIGCYVHDLSWGGVDLKEFDENNVALNYLRQNQIVEYNRIENCGRDCISLHNCKGATVQFNKIKRHHWHGIHDYVNCVDSVIQFNVMDADNINRVGFYPKHLQDFPTVDGIIIDHVAYRDSEVKNTKVMFNNLDGYQQGILTDGYATNYKIIGNQILNSGSNAIQLSWSLGSCYVESNKIDGCQRGIGLGFSVSGSNTAMYPTYPTDLKCTINISNNTIDNPSDSHMRFSIKKTNDNGVDIIATHLIKAMINVEKNVFLASKTKPSYCIVTGYMEAGDRATFKFSDNNGVNAFSTSLLNVANITQIISIANVTGLEAPPVIIANSPSVNRTSADPLTSFTPKTIEYYEVGSSNASGFPLNTAGILITYRGINDIYNFQEYNIRQGLPRYKRYWDTTNNVWTDWTKISVV